MNRSANPGEISTVDFHFDVMCPLAYQTSLWLRELRDQLDLTANWRFFNLEDDPDGGDVVELGGSKAAVGRQ